MIKKIYDRDTGNIYDVGGSERKVLTLDDINPEIKSNEEELVNADVRLNDRNYNNTHIVIDVEKISNEILVNAPFGTENLTLYLNEQNKNCTIQFINVKDINQLRIFGGRTTCLELPFPYPDIINENLGWWCSYYEENIENVANDVMIVCSDSYTDIVIVNIDSYGNVSIKPIKEGEQ